MYDFCAQHMLGVPPYSLCTTNHVWCLPYSVYYRPCLVSPLLSVLQAIFGVPPTQCSTDHVWCPSYSVYYRPCLVSLLLSVPKTMFGVPPTQCTTGHVWGHRRDLDTI